MCVGVQEKWDKTKSLVKELDQMMRKDARRLSRKRLEQIRGFLGYVSQTYHILATYMKGLHLTIDSWREGRDDEGWKVPGWESVGEEEGAPETVEAVPRLRGDVEAMLSLTEATLPPQRQVRMERKGRVLYGFGDASARGFGSTVEVNGNTHYEYGQWVTNITEETSSNWKELCNLIESVERWYDAGWLSKNELWLFTDNSTAENAFWKGTSKSRKLFELVLRIKKLEMRGDFVMHVVHVSGLRMIQQGTDGISRGDKTEGVMGGGKMMDYVPLHLGVTERSTGMIEFVKEIMYDINYELLDPSGWFNKINKEGNFVWVPPPSCGEIVLEQLGNARHKRPNGMHIVLIPRLLTGRWRRLLGRATDFSFTLWPDPAWPLATMFEPCVVFVGLPFLSHRPLLTQTESRVERFRRQMSGSGMREADWRKRRVILREFLRESRRICPL